MLRTSVKLGDTQYEVRFTERSEGNFSGITTVDKVDLERRRRAIIDRPWVWSRLQHEAGVLKVGEAWQEVVGQAGDALVSSRADIALSVHVADCGNVALLSEEGVFAVVHVGWRGALAGVIEACVAEMRRAGASRLYAVVGPSISARQYEFVGEMREAFVRKFPSSAEARTDWGALAISIPGAVKEVLDREDISVIEDFGECGSPLEKFFSYRMLKEPERMAMVVWKSRSPR